MYRFFKCNRLGGFRLTDLNKKVHTDEYLYFEEHVCDTSRSINGALKAKWMLEVTEKEASQSISVPGEVKDVKSEPEQIETTKKNLGKAQVDAKETNKSLESRQAERNFRRPPMQKQKQEDKPAVPNFNQAERRIRERQADIMTKGSDELLKSPVKKKEPAVIIKPPRKDVVENLAKEIQADNSQLSTPNFDEKKQEAKKEIREEIEKKVKVRGRRRKVTLAQEA